MWTPMAVFMMSMGLIMLHAAAISVPSSIELFFAYIAAGIWDCVIGGLIYQSASKAKAQAGEG